MSSENSATQSRNLPFSIENILREDFPPKSKLAFPPKNYSLPEGSKDKSSAAPCIRWVPLPRYTAFLPLYYGRFMYLQPSRTKPMEPKDLDVGKKNNTKACLDCNSTKSNEERVGMPGQGENQEQVETKSSDSSADEHEPSDHKEPQSRKRRRTRSQFTPMQIKYLEKYYSNHSYLSRDERTVLAQALDMTELQIRNWFQNKRYHKKNKLEK